MRAGANGTPVPEGNYLPGGEDHSIGNIQDVTFIEGPLLKHFQLSILKFETAGQRAGQAHAMRLIGIMDAHAFRAELLQRREALKHRPSPQTGSTLPADSETLTVLRAILLRLDEIARKLN